MRAPPHVCVSTCATQQHLTLTAWVVAVPRRLLHIARLTNPRFPSPTVLCPSLPPSRRCLKKNPELVEEFVDRAAALLHDKNQAVSLAGVTLMLAITGLDATAVERYRAHVPTLCKMLRQLLQVRLGGRNGTQRTI